MTFPGPKTWAFYDRVIRLHRNNLRRGFNSATVLVSPRVYDTLAEEFRFAPYGWMILGLPVEIGPVPSVAVTKARQAVLCNEP